ncbi:hypothetical protein MMC20_003072 [Loxospora ochrophaea]|nr:hypothetical protein [Loxospora ochrophaea]
MATTLLNILPLFEPAIKLGLKTRRTYTLQASFGRDFSDYSKHFISEWLFLHELLKTPIDILDDEDTRAELGDALGIGSPQEFQERLQRRPDQYQKTVQIRSSLATLSQEFDRCTALIEKYTPPSAASHAPRATDSHSSDLPLQDHSSPPTQDDGLPPSESLQRSARPSRHRRLLRQIIPSGRSRPVSASASSPSFVRPDALERPDVQRQRALQEAQSRALQNETTVRKQGSWILKDADEFRNSIERIRKENALLERLLQSSEPPQNPFISSATTDSVDNVIHDGSSRSLAVLQKIFSESARSEDTSFALQLKEHYKFKSLEEVQQRNFTYLDPHPDVCLFPVTAHSAASSESGGLRSTSQVLISTCDQRQENSEPAPSSSQWEFTHSSLEVPRPGGRHYNHRYSFSKDGYDIKIFQHDPGHISTTTQIMHLLDDGRLRDDELVGFRCHLAYTIAAFFYNAYDAQLPINRRELVYFLHKASAQIDAEELTAYLLAPCLQNIEHESHSVSLHGSQTAPFHSVQKLGVLLQEIGCWTPILEAGEPQLRLERVVDRAKAKARGSQVLGLPYYSVVKECLNWQTTSLGGQFYAKVLLPLKKLSSKHERPTTDTYM